MKITIELEGEYGVDATRVERTVSWADQDGEPETVETISGEPVIHLDPKAERLKAVTTRIAALAVDIHTTR